MTALQISNNNLSFTHTILANIEHQNQLLTNTHSHSSVWFPCLGLPQQIALLSKNFIPACWSIRYLIGQRSFRILDRTVLGTVCPIEWPITSYDIPSHIEVQKLSPHCTIRGQLVQNHHNPAKINYPLPSFTSGCLLPAAPGQYY